MSNANAPTPTHPHTAQPEDQDNAKRAVGPAGGPLGSSGSVRSVPVRGGAPISERADVVGALISERVSRGLSQRAVRRLIVDAGGPRLSTATISQWERRENEPSLTYLGWWARVLGQELVLVPAASS